MTTTPDPEVARLARLAALPQPASERVTMADEKQDEKQGDGTNVDYSKSQADIDKAKAKAADADRERLAEESQ